MFGTGLPEEFPALSTSHHAFLLSKRCAGAYVAQTPKSELGAEAPSLGKFLQVTPCMISTWSPHKLLPVTRNPCNLASNSMELFCCCCSVAQSCPTLCDSMDYSISGFPILHYLPEFVQTHVHWVSDAIQSSHSLSPPSPLALLNLEQIILPALEFGASRPTDSVHFPF